METTTSADKSPCDIRGYERVFVQWDVGFCLLLLSITARRGCSQHVAFYGNLIFGLFGVRFRVDVFFAFFGRYVVIWKRLSLVKSYCTVLFDVHMSHVYF